MKISIYKNAEDNAGKLYDFSKILKAIKNGQWKEQVEALRLMSKDEYKDAKKSLPCVTYSGTFLPTRHDAHLQTYNNIVTIDIDHIAPEVLDDLTDALPLDQHVLCVFKSPSAEGLKVLIPVTTGAEHHLDAFESLRLYFKSSYEVDIDPSGKNLARLCFVSYDPELHYNGAATPFPVEVTETARERMYSDRSMYSKDSKVTTDELKIYALAKDWTSIHKPYVVLANGNTKGGNDHIFTLSCNLNRLGMAQENAVLSIARDCVQISVQEIKDTVRKVYKSKAKEFKTITAFDFAKEQDSMRGAMEMHSPADIMDQLASAPSEGLIKSGFERQDKTFGGGKERGAVYAYIGREKTYKSVHAIKEACYLAKSGMPVLYLNGEMSKRQFMQIVAQQQMGIPRIQFMSHLEEITNWAKENLSCLSVVTGKDFTYDKILKSVDAIRSITGKDVAQVFVDGITHMDPLGREEIPATIESAKTLKEVAKGCNEGRMAAITVLIHTDASCKHWSRMPQSFVRGKGKVLANFDGHVGFSRFVIAGTNNDDWSEYELREDLYNIRIKDERLTGETCNVVMHLDQNCSPRESGDDLTNYELDYTPKKQSRY